MAIKTRLIISFQHHPFRSKVILFVGGVAAGLLHFWFGEADSHPWSSVWLFQLGLVSTLVYAFMLTLYRILQRLFRSRLKTRQGLIEFDERLVVLALAAYGLMPYAATVAILSHLTGVSPAYGMVVLVQGAAIAFGAGISRIIKK